MRGRPGDWTCLQCGARPCFARTAQCFRCNAPRNGAIAMGAARAERAGEPGGSFRRAASQEAHCGPVGAGGSRPLLGRRGEAGGRDGRAGLANQSVKGPLTRAPSVNVPKADDVADGGMRASQGLQAGSSTSPHADAEGFQEVRLRGGARSWAEVAAAVPTARGSTPVETRNAWDALDDADAMDIASDGPEQAVHDKSEAEHDARAGRADHADGDEADDGDGRADACPGEGGDDGDVDQLRRMWNIQCAAVRRLERDSQGFPAAILEAAKAQRDAAEQRWRAARRPHPWHKRLRWAENDLREAEAKERLHQEELAAHLEQSARRTRELQDRVEVDAARTARKRQLVAALQREGAVHLSQSTERAARIAVEGLGGDISHALGAIIRKLGDGDEAVRRELQQVASSIGYVQELLRDAAEQDLASRRPACFNIADDDAGGTEAGGSGASNGGGRGGGGDSAADESAAGPPGATKCTRWTKPAENGPWRKDSEVTSVAAVEEARRRVRARTENDCHEGVAAARDIGAGGSGNGGPGTNLDGACGDPSCTNDLAEAARREQRAAHLQVQQVHQRQQLLADARQQQEDEAQRQLRAQNQQEEMRRHQAAFEQAAAARAAEEDRRRAELLASLTPEELARATELHARNAAVGAQVFGSAAASHAAGLVQQSHDLALAQRQQQAQQLQGSHASDPNADPADREEIDRLMAMSVEDFAAWDGQHQGL